MTTEISAIQVGTLAIPTRASGVCDAGERGVCYEVYTLGGRHHRLPVHQRHTPAAGF
jgi:hypothetical protein